MQKTSQDVLELLVLRRKMHQLFTIQGVQVRGRDKEQFIVSGEPFAETECRSEARKLAKVWLFDHPEDTVLLAEDRHVQEWLRNTSQELVGHWQSRYYRISAVYISHILFLLTYILAQACHNYGWIGLLSIVGAAVFYQLLWRLEIQNEIESAVATEIAYLLFLFAVPVASIIRSHG